MKLWHQRANESLQKLAAYVRRHSTLACTESSNGIREYLMLQYFTDSVLNFGIQQALRLLGVKDVVSILTYSLKYETAHQATGQG